MEYTLYIHICTYINRDAYSVSHTYIHKHTNSLSHTHNLYIKLVCIHTGILYTRVYISMQKWPHVVVNDSQS